MTDENTDIQIAHNHEKTAKAFQMESLRCHNIIPDEQIKNTTAAMV